MDGYIADGYGQKGHHCPEDAEWYRKAQVGGNTWTFVTAGGARIGGLHDTWKVVEEFKKLPESERKPKVAEDPEIEKGILHLRPPVRGLAARLYNTALERGADGELRRAGKSYTDLYATSAGCVEPALTQIDMFWMTEEEVRSLIPAEPAVGASFRVPPMIERRMLVYTVPCTASVGDRGELTLTVTQVTTEGVELRLDGWSRQGGPFQEAREAFGKPGKDGKPSKAATGQATRWLGKVCYDSKKKAIAVFNIVGIGTVWGDAFNKKYGTGGGSEPRRWPAGYAFELATSVAADRITPPQIVQNGLYNSNLTDWYWGRK